MHYSDTDDEAATFLVLTTFNSDIGTFKLLFFVLQGIQ